MTFQDYQTITNSQPKMKYSMLVFALLSLCAYSAHGSEISQKDKVLAGTIVVDTTVLENVVPQSQQLLEKQEAFLSVLDGIVSLNEVKMKVQSNAPYLSSQYLNGLSVLLSEIISDGCAWMNATIDEGFSCNSQGFADLRNKLRAYETLDRTALSLKEYFTNSDSSCM